MAVRTLHNSNEISALAVAAKRSCAPQWRAFMEALGSALPEITGDEMALRILAKTGAAIAKAQPLSPCNSLKDLKAAINTGLEAMDWGQVDIRETERALEFVIVGYPHFEGVDARAAFAATLEALLDAWLSLQASRPGLSVRLAERGAGSYPPLVFRYERGVS